MTLQQAVELGGYYAAHAAWCLSTADHMAPLIGYLTADGRRKLVRLSGLDEDVAVEQGRAALAANPWPASAAVLVYDGWLPEAGTTRELIAVVVRAYGDAGGDATFAVPYTPRRTGRFRVQQPLLLRSPPDLADPAPLLAAFSAGVNAHTDGREVWQRSFAPPPNVRQAW